MSTNSYIGVLREDDTVTYIFCNWDGYPDHHLPILREAYNTEAKIEELLALGGLSQLGRELGEKHAFGDDAHPTWCKAYGRDRGDYSMPPADDTDANAFRNGIGYSAYTYLFTDGDWQVYQDGVRVETD